MARSVMPTTIKLDGPFFRRDPAKTFRQNVRALMDEVAREAEEDVKAQVPVKTGALKQGIVGRTSSVNGRRWAVTAVVSATHVYPWPNGAPKQYRGGKVAAPIFRRTARRLRRAVKTVDLTKDM